jgi:subtilisin family serine protease
MRTLVAVTAVASTAFALAVAPGAGASGRRPIASLARRHALTSGLTALRHQPAGIDPALLRRRGPVDVMIQLAPKPAVVPYARAAHAPVAHRLAVFRSQAGRVQSAQRALAVRVDDLSIGARRLFAVHNLYDGVAVRVDAAHLAALSTLPGVIGVHTLVPKHLLNTVTVPLIGAPQAWEGTAGTTGAGVKVGIIDTGIDYTHADFGGPGTTTAYAAARATDSAAPNYPDLAKVAGGFDFAGDNYDPAAGPVSQGGDGNPIAYATPAPDSNPLDCSGHGTHVAGTAAGLGVNPDGTTFTGDYTSLGALTPAQYQAKFKIGPGVAPGATLYALKIFGCGEESGTGSDLIAAALDWAAAIQPDGRPRLNVVNMSLGADFSTADDPDAVAADNASLAGVTVVAAAGNAGDEFNAAGAPGNAVRAISVAASDDNTDLVDGVTFSDEPGNQPAEESSAFNWSSPTPNGFSISGQLAVIGDGNQADFGSPSPGDAGHAPNNSDGCDPLSTADMAKAAGKVLLLSWTDNDSARRCGSAVRTQNAHDAGAVGVVLVDDEDEFAAGILGDASIPTVITTAKAGAPVVQDLFAGKSVTTTLTYALHNKVTSVHPATQDAIATFSSRGGGAAGTVKPDIAAPGVTVFSALYGSGDDGTSNNGTSMATPHVAGSAALVKAVHPDWTPEQVKAALMDTAGNPVYARASDGSANQTAPEAPERVGAGRVQVNQAVANSVLAYAANANGAVSVSFGPISTASPLTIGRAITVQNTSASAVTYSASYAAANSNPGATYALTTTGCATATAGPVTVSVPAGSSVQLGVCLTIDPTRLTSHPDPTLVLKPTLASPYDVFNGIERSFISTASGRVVLTPQAGGVTLRVPVYAAPRPASSMSLPASVALPTSNKALTLSGKGVDGGSPAGTDAREYSIAEAFELQGNSRALPACAGSQAPPGCVPNKLDRSGDLRYVGFASDGELYQEAGLNPLSVDPAGDGSVLPALGYIGIAAQGQWPSSDFPLYIVWFDLNNDGNPDAVLFNDRIPGTDVFLAELASVDSNGVPQFLYDAEPLNLVDGSVDSGVFDSDVVTMPFALAALKQIAKVDNVSMHSRIAYFVDSGTIDAGLIDSVGDPLDGGTPMTINPATPGLDVVEGFSCGQVSGVPHTSNGVCFSPVLIDDQPGVKLLVHRDANVVADHPLGLLLLHHDNVPGQRAQVVRFATKVSTSLRKSPAPPGYRDPLAVHVTSTVGTPAGTVIVTEGRTRLAKGRLHGGRVTLTLPKRSVGRHRLTVSYVPDAAHTASARIVILRVVQSRR